MEIGEINKRTILKNPDINITDVVSNKSYFENLNGEPTVSDELILSVCTSGEAIQYINGKKYYISKNTLCVKTKGAFYSVSDVSDDYDGYEIVLPMELLKDITFNFKNIYSTLMYFYKFPCSQLSDEQLKDFVNLINISNILKDNVTYYKKEFYQGFVISIIYFVCELMRKNKDSFDDRLNELSHSDRKFYYYINFLDLAGKYCNTERGIAFYAEKLYITPKYLSSVIKDISGLSAGEWINKFVMIEAKTLLQSTDTNIAEIAYKLNFPNTSFFGSFFKKHEGITPGEFKRKCLKKKDFLMAS